jgi:O-antigen/teichoic acid export membrane protein
LLYSVKKPFDILIGNVVIFLVVSIGCFLFIPTYGVLAAIGSLGVAFTLASIILIALSIKEYKKLPAE